MRCSQLAESYGRFSSLSNLVKPHSCKDLHAPLWYIVLMHDFAVCMLTRLL